MAAVLCLGLPALALAQIPSPSPTNCQNDVDGANDHPGQKDVTRTCFDAGDTSPYDLLSLSNWDEITLTGGNTADVCTLFDSNSNAFADLAVCVTLASEGAPTQTAILSEIRLFNCTDTKPDRCTGSTQINVCTGGSTCLVDADCPVGETCAQQFSTTCEVAQAPSDPFSPTDPNGPGDAYPDDTEILCGVNLSDFGVSGSTARLIDTCSYPSTQPNSAPSDCINFAGCSVDADCAAVNACTVGSCDPGGFCVFTPTPGAPCSDGLFCNGDDVCNALGFCEDADGLPTRDCDDGVTCTIDSCDELLDECVNAPSNSLCNDTDFCNGVEICDPVNDCQAGTPPDCDDGVGCTDDSCNETTDECDHVPNDANCDDGASCNGLETCDAANDCQAGTPPDCNDGVGCTDDSCNEATDECENVPNDANCDDGASCNGSETCDAVNDCQNGTPVDCDDGVGCTIDSCNETTDSCDNTPNDASCDDGAFCNGTETCDPAGDCQDGTPPTIDDGVPCTDDSCDEINDTIVNTPNNTNCTNGQFCDGVEICDQVSDCQVGANPCPGLSCDEVADQCSNCLFDADCDNSVFCDGAETCNTVTGNCEAGTSVDCDDTVGCTVDSCNETTDSCDNTPNDASCSDGAFCNGAETCDPANDCQGGAAPDCDDLVGCTDDSCNETTNSCNNVANSTGCDDGLFCNGSEICDPVGDCQSGTDPCPAGTNCIEATDTCELLPVCTDDTDCDDLQFCNGAETCDVASGNCLPGTPVDCSDGFGCSVNACDEAADECAAPDFSSCICGDGEAVPSIGEECDPPVPAGSFEDCNNNIDDDGDGKVDCRDLDCAPDARTPVCDEACVEDVVCAKFIKDPGLIKFRFDEKPDRFTLHGQFPLANAVLNPLWDEFFFELSNDRTPIYRSSVAALAFRPNKQGNRFVFKDRDAKHLGQSSSAGGLFRVGLKVRPFEGVPHVAFRVKAYGDFKLADRQKMTTQISVGAETGFFTVKWDAKRKKWRLPLKNFGCAVEGPAGDETCGDGLDNDCDGYTDAADTDCR